jgi:aminoglycoside phosphotransferase (APT) family kinase protein
LKYEPFIDRAQLIKIIYEVYGLAIEVLTFIPVGAVAVCYSLDSVNGERHFLKLWPDTRAGREIAAKLNIVLPLTRALYERELYPRVPYPIPTREGNLWAAFMGSPFAIFPLLPGQTPPSEWPPSLQDEFGRTMATLHQVTSALADLFLPRENFDISFEIDLRRGLAALAQIGSQARPGLRALRDAVLPRTEEVLAQLDRLHHLQEVVRQLSGPFVLCHTDIGGDNLLVDDQGQFYVLDWDDVILAPPEHDLQEARWVGFGRCLEAYRAAGGIRPLQLGHFAFYLLRRHLGDMTMRLLHILEENSSPEEDEDALYGIEAWGFAQWAALDETLDSMAAALSLLK